jgi:uncharacterized membrane protein
MGNLFESVDRTGEFDSADIQANSAFCGLSYIPPLFFLPLVTAQNSKFGKFHANQALLVLIAFIASSFAGLIIGIILGSLLGAIPFIGLLFKALSYIIKAALGLSAFVLMILGMVNAFSGKAKELPLIGKYTILK